MRETVIDYIIGSKEVRERRELKVGYKIDSNHQPIEAVIKRKERWYEERSEQKGMERNMGQGGEKVLQRRVW